MASRILWRRSAAAAGTYSAAALGFAGTIVTARLLGPEAFALFALATAASTFSQVFLDLTMEEALVKYGFRYVTHEQWGKLHRLFRLGVVVKVVGGFAAAVPVLVLAPFADAIWTDGLLLPMAIAAAMPVAQAPEGVGASALLLRSRYDVRAALLAVSMALRLAGLTVGSLYGVTAAMTGAVVAQALGTACVWVVGRAAFRRFPAAAPEPLAADARPLRSFVIQSSVQTGLTSMRAMLGTLLIGVVAPTLQVSYFRAAQAPITALASLSAPARLILLAEQTRDFERGRIGRVFQLLRRYVLGTTAAMAVLLPLAWWFMPALIRLGPGSQYLPAVTAARLVLLVGALQLIWGWTKSFPVSIGRPGLRNVVAGVEIGVFVPLLLVFGDLWGATGGAAAMLASTAVFALLWTVLAFRLRRQLTAAPPRPRVEEVAV